MRIVLESFLVAAAAAAPAMAQQALEPDPSGKDIVVQGNRNTRSDIDNFVSALTDVRVFGQVSRFDWAVCPKVFGLDDRQDTAVEERLRDVAGAAGIDVAKPGCKPNVLVVVTKDVPSLIEGLKRDHPGYFKDVPVEEKRKLKRHGEAAAAWHIEGRLDADGVEVPRDRITGQYVVERTDVPSRISTTTRPHFTSAVVAVDIDSLDGLTVTQLADYAAMRAFARTDPTRLEKSAAPTILTILDAPMGSEVPITLTEWDFAYLKALYSSTENRFAGQQRHEMGRKRHKDLAAPPKEEE